VTVIEPNQHSEIIIELKWWFSRL